MKDKQDKIKGKQDKIKGKKDKIRILLAKVGIDDHSRPLYVLSKSFRDAGFEVIMGGTHQSVDSVVNTAIHEAVDVLGLSFHTSGHLGWCREITERMKERGGYGIKIVAGGIIPDEDKPVMERMGVTGNFGPGTPLDVINNHIRKIAEL